jgi:hypothetical protein
MTAAGIMEAFCERTGVTSGSAPRRYLWTDAFAVCNCIALHEQTGDAQWLERAVRLVDQVHHVLGRHRADDARTGWISGLDEAAGERHPTAGGLRIGKPLPERRAGEPVDEHVDWDRDGQYYHYLTRWMHALARAADATGDVRMLQYGVELARATHAAFSHTIAGEKRLYWKMSIDLTHPVVDAMGQHDALDGFVATAALAARAAHAGAPGVSTDGPGTAPALRERGGAVLAQELADLAEMCSGRGWATADALGVGGLLTDALFLARLSAPYPAAAMPADQRAAAGAYAAPPPTSPDDTLFVRVLRDAARSLELIALGRPFDAPADARLAFRELGLSLGLAAAERLEALLRAGPLPGGAAAAASVESLARHAGLRARIESFWLEPAHQTVESWRAHEDINAVMLAASILPDGYLGDPSLP